MDSTSTEDIPHAYASLFGSNACPPAQAYTDIHALIADHEQELAAIQANIANLKSSLADMQRRKVHNQSALVQLRATLAPIKRLPPEILSEIFMHTLNTTTDDARLPLARSKTAPLLLGRICRTWRAVAYGTPHLWCHISINVCNGCYSDSLRPDALPVLLIWLAHAGSLPLHLVVHCKSERVLPGLVDVFETIVVHGTRWRTIKMRLQNAHMVYRLVCRTVTQCTALETLDVSDGGQSTVSYFGLRQPVGSEDLEPVSFDLVRAPALRAVSLSLAGLVVRDVQVQWAVLTRLSFMQDARSSTSSIADYLAILEQCTVPEECGLVIDSGETGDAPPAPVTLPNLARLGLQVLRGASSTAQTGTFLSALHTPRLDALSIEDYCPRQGVVLYQSALKAFLRTHARTLRQLRFSTSSTAFSSTDMVGLVEETPQLGELAYQPEEGTSPRELLEALTPREGEGCLLAGLERLSVYWDTTATVSMVGDMVERRYAQGIARLTHLSCRPARLITAYDCAPPAMVVENLAARLAPLGLQVEWEGYRYDHEWA